jgi:small subunit ribosomal protein S8
MVMVTDPIADMLTRIRNAVMARHDTVTIPASKTKLVIAKILKDEGFISDFSVAKGKVDKTIKISLRYLDNQPAINGLERVSKPGLRVYVGSGEVPRVYGGLGISILSTSKGIMVGQEAWKQKLGGELLCHIW